MHVSTSFSGLETEDLSSLSKTQFSLKMIASATKNFDDENKIGEGGFGVVFKVCRNPS